MADLLVEREKVSDEIDYVVALASAKGAKGEVSKPFEILRVGDFKRGSRSVPITSTDLDEAVDNFNRWKAMGQEIPVDYDHAFSEGRPAPAAGWYDSLSRKDDTLYATVKWTDKAREEIQSGLYRFFSPEFHKSFISEEGSPEGFTILAGALTNRPFLRGMTPVALSQEVADEIDGWVSDRFSNLTPEQLEALADTPREVSLLKDKNKNGEQAETFKVEIDGETQEFTADEIVAMNQAKVDAEAEAAKQEKAAKDAKAEAAAKETTIETLSTRVDSMEKRDKDRDFTDIFKQAKREGRVDAKDETETTWRETFDQLGAEKTKALLEQIPAETVPMTAQGRGGSNEVSTAPKGYDEDRHAMNQKVESYLEEHPDATFTQALDIVRREAAQAEARS